LRRSAGTDRLRHEALVGIKPDPRRFDLVAWRQQCRAFRGRFERFGNHHGDRLAGIADAIVLQEIEPEHEWV
jgi:hypothetical protein